MSIIFWLMYQFFGWYRNSVSIVYMHYSYVTMGAVASQITSLTIVYATVYSGADQRKNQSSTSRAFVWGIHWRPVNSPHKGPVTRKMFPFDDVIMDLYIVCGDMLHGLTTDTCQSFGFLLKVMLHMFLGNETHFSFRVESLITIKPLIKDPPQ